MFLLTAGVTFLKGKLITSLLCLEDFNHSPYSSGEIASPLTWLVKSFITYLWNHLSSTPGPPLPFTSHLSAPLLYSAIILSLFLLLSPALVSLDCRYHSIFPPTLRQLAKSHSHLSSQHSSQTYLSSHILRYVSLSLPQPAWVKWLLPVFSQLPNYFAQS